MSRIEEALARARNVTPENLVPPPIETAVKPAEPVFAADAEAPASSADVPYPAIERSAVDSAQFETVEEPAETEVDPTGDFRALPSAEKLMLTGGDSTAVEQYRRLAARLLMAQAEQGTRVVMVTSALPGEGKTLTATNLALTLSESYKKNVLLIDADLRRPWVHEIFKLPNVSGLNDGLRSDAERKVPLIRMTDHLSVLTAGRPDPDPMSVLSGDRMRRVLAEASSRFDFVIVDTPPVALLSDAHLLSSLVDAALLVVQSAATQLPAIKTAVQAVGRDRILGVVLNRAATGLANSAYDYYGYRA